MKVNVDQEITFFGQTMREGDAPMTVREVVKISMNFMADAPNGRRSPQDMLKRYRLAQRVDKGGEVDFSAEDVSMAKEAAAQVLMPFAFGALCDILEARAETDSGDEPASKPN